jgi:hypothetical protein
MKSTICEKMHYRMFGLAFRSNCELCGLDQTRETSNVDYTLNFDQSNRFEKLRPTFQYPCYTSSWRMKCGRVVLRVWKTEINDKFLFRFYDNVEFIIDREGGDIWVNCMELEAATRHLLFSLPGFLLGLRKSACLQGAAIRGAQGAVALLGKSKSGKSVLSASMAARGFDVLSDDLVALNVVGDTASVYPGYPWICLRPESLQWLGCKSFKSNQVQSKWQYLDETYVTWDLHRVRWSNVRPSNLEAIYLLAPVEDSTCISTINPVPKHKAVVALMEAAQHTRLPCSEFTRQEFSLMGSIVAAAIPVYKLSYHLSADNLPFLSNLLEQRLRKQQGRESAKA